jgi:hypothetical protein
MIGELVILALVAGSIASILGDFLTVRRLRRAKKHDRILYRFCKVRDSIAELAIEGKISEDTRIFNFFYLNNAYVIHNHTRSGVCFSDLLREIDRTIEPVSEDEAAWIQALVGEIQEAGPKVREIVRIYENALFEAILTSLNLILLDRLLRWMKVGSESVLRAMASSFLFPRATRRALLFWQSLELSMQPSVRLPTVTVG